MGISRTPERFLCLGNGHELFGFTHNEATESLFTRPGFVVIKFIRKL